MNFPFNFFAAAFFGALLTSLLALPLWRKWCLRTNLVDDPGHRKIHSAPVPLAGGFAVLTGILLPLLTGAVLLKLDVVQVSAANAIVHGLDRRAVELLVLALGAVAITVLGWLDDKHELKALPKFLGQIIIAIAVASACKRITLFVHSETFSYAITILWLLTVINAFNFMDNMNGLCAGLGVIAAAWFGLQAALLGQYLVATLALLSCGALLGFLPYNYPKATAFLGDAGSHLTGYLLAVMAILPHFYSKKHPHPWAVLTPLLVLAVPLADLAWVVLLRWRMGQPFYVGDTNHLSHRLVRRGWSKPRAVLVIWLLAAVAGALSLL